MACKVFIRPAVVLAANLLPAPDASALGYLWLGGGGYDAPSSQAQIDQQILDYCEGHAL